MTAVSLKKSHDSERVNENSEKPMENSELASFVSELSTAAVDAGELVKSPLQASNNVGLQAEVDAYLDYGHSDRKAESEVETAQENNHRNGVYIKTINSEYGVVEVTVPRERAGMFTPWMEG